MKRLFLVAGGPSANIFDYSEISKHGQLIGVNDCGFLIPEVSTMFTMDRLWLENRWEIIRHQSKRFIVHKCVWQKFLGKIYSGQFEPTARLLIEPVQMDHTETILHLGAEKVNGRNSGFCAFNWAVQQKPDEIFLFGFDMQAVNGQRHFHKPYPWSPNVTNRYAKWAEDFDESKPTCDQIGLKVYNCSPVSLIEAFPRVASQKALMDVLK